jgi:outer membrane lipoprotein-sorting protein
VKALSPGLLDNAPDEQATHSDGMTSRATRRLRWLVPAVIAAAIAAASLTTTAAANASDQPKLAPKTAADLLVAIEQADPAGLSGTIVETAKLGLPDLSGVAGAGGSGGDSSLTVETLVTGSHTMNVWYAGADHQRFALLGQLSESDVIHNGTDLWTYSSTTRTVTHKTLSGHESANAKPSIASAAPALDPQTAAEQALAAIDPTTTVQVDRTARVAGRAAYQLLLSPKDTRSLIGSVSIAVDAATFVPLRVQIYATGATTPAVQVGFTDISFNVPNMSVFDFVPPAGATVQENATPFDSVSGPRVYPPGQGPSGSSGPSAAPALTAERTTLLGKGWTQVAEISLPTPAGTPPAGAQIRLGGANSQLLDQAATVVPGGRLITTKLVSILITNDGKIFAGPVNGADLQKVASSGQGL